MGQFTFECEDEQCGGSGEQFDWTEGVIVEFEVKSVGPIPPTAINLGAADANALSEAELRKIMDDFAEKYSADTACAEDKELFAAATAWAKAGGFELKQKRSLENMDPQALQQLMWAHAAESVAPGLGAFVQQNPILQQALGFPGAANSVGPNDARAENDAGRQLGSSTGASATATGGAGNQLLAQLHADRAATTKESVALRAQLTRHLASVAQAEQAAAEAMEDTEHSEEKAGAEEQADTAGQEEQEDEQEKQVVDWGPGYRFYVLGRYDTYGRVCINGADDNVSFYGCYSETDEALLEFSRCGQRIRAHALGGRCYGSTNAPGDRAQAWRACCQNIAGVVYTEVPTSEAADTDDDVALFARTGAAFGSQLEAACSDGDKKLMNLLNHSSEVARAEWMHHMITSGQIASSKILGDLLDANSDASELTLLLLANGAGMPCGFNQANVSPSPLVLAAQQNLPQAIEALLKLGATRGALEALEHAARQLVTLQTELAEQTDKHFAPGGPGFQSADADFSSLARTGSVRAPPEEASEPLLQAQKAESDCKKVLSLLQAHRQEWVPILTEFLNGIRTLQPHYDGYECMPATGPDALAQIDYVEPLIRSAYVVMGAQRISRVHGPPIKRVLRCLDKMDQAIARYQPEQLSTSLDETSQPAESGSDQPPPNGEIEGENVEENSKRSRTKYEEQAVDPARLSQKNSVAAKRAKPIRRCEDTSSEEEEEEEEEGEGCCVM